MVYIFEIVGFIILCWVFEKIRDMTFYNWILNHSKYSCDSWAKTKESFAYYVTKIVEAIPTFSFAPSSWEFMQYKNEWDSTYNKGEKTICGIGILFLYVRAIVGNCLLDFVLIGTFLIKNNYLQVDAIKLLFKKIDIKVVIEKIVSYMSDNNSMLLLLVIFFLAVYAFLARKRIAKYQLEAIWRKNNENVERVAVLQKKLENILIRLMPKIYSNTQKCKQNIRFIDAQKYTNDSYLIKNYVDFTDDLTEIRKILLEISEVTYGLSIYAKHNYKSRIQIRILGLLPGKTVGCFELDACNKDSFEKIDLSISRTELRKEFMHKWMQGISQVNGIIRYLKHVNRKMAKYQKIANSIVDTKEMKEIVEKISK